MAVLAEDVSNEIEDVSNETEELLNETEDVANETENVSDESRNCFRRNSRECRTEGSERICGEQFPIFQRTADPKEVSQCICHQ